ncbi:MAG: Na+/H+ antiporter NhaA [Bacteroidota bacterium]
MAHSTAPLSPNPLVRSFQKFIRAEAAGGILLLLSAVVALIWANSALSASYFALWETMVTVGFGSLVINKPLLLWVNDGLMAIFFFLIGLEIKREVLAGELSSPKKAAMALAGAVGGMVVPAGFYVALNWGGDGINGWAIPMATDIAFALGVLALMGKKAPLALKVFLTALAIVDDLGAVLVIAFFYTAKLSWTSLAVGGGFLLLLIAANRLGVRRTSVYVILGIGLWVAFLKSGVHATIAGVLLALTIPFSRKTDARSFLDSMTDLVGLFKKEQTNGQAEPTAKQEAVLHKMEVQTRNLDAPLLRMEHALHGWIAFFIMPVFAMANAGVALGGGLGSAFGEPVTLGIIAGLFLGKQIGVFSFAWLAVKAGWAALPTGVSWKQVYGVSLLTGIGFTMSLFIAGLAFDTAAMLDSAKIGILSASLLSGLAGWAVLSWAYKPSESSSTPAGGTPVVTPVTPASPVATPA